ncbi:hypothetical protein [Rubinisphaera italica]|uniref:Uncharacterized protein n=1 Tax=Rubinisphaera italica TaxID=2527969 RepID=A0A5C5XHA7_9PLAN|nr:hypothetical protein [Rubinisphaera italica]TWT61252.1 hypothetical protein Pan54_19870 [Rubinisphaera italica]
MSHSCQTIEELVVLSSPTVKAGDGLRLQLMRQARKEAWQRTARRQLTVIATLFIVLFVVAESQLHSVSRTAAVVMQPLVIPPSQSKLCKLDVSPESIGEWGHVEAVLAYRSHVSSSIRL